MSESVTPVPGDGVGVPASVAGAGGRDVATGGADEPAPGIDLPSKRQAGRTARYAGATLDAILPGLGLLVRGRHRLAALFLLPIVVAVTVAAVAIGTMSRTELLVRLIDPSVLIGLLVGQAFVLAWRLAAVGSNLAVSRPPGFGRADILPVLALAAFVVLPQAWLGYVTNTARTTAETVFEPVTGGVWHPSPPPPTPLPSGATPAPATPAPSPTPAVPRVTILLIGMDSGVGRHTALTDSMIVASLDPVGKTVSMLSIPRDLVDAPEPNGAIFHPKINSLATYAKNHPAEFPGSNGDGQAVLAGTVGSLIGVQVDYWAQVNLGGFLRLVDSLGGVDVNVAHSFCDPGYDEYGQNGFSIRAGRWHLNGSQALAYARVRKASGESDFTRAARQQEVLIGIRDAVVRAGFLNDPVGFLDALGQTVLTNVPPDVLPEVTPFADAIGRDRVYRAVVKHPLVTPGFDVRGSIQIPDVAGIRALAARVFPPPGVTPVGDEQPGSSPQATAGPAPKPGSTSCRPAATPRPKPTTPASASAEPSTSGGPSTSVGPSPSESGSGEPPASSSPEPSAPGVSPSSAPAPGDSGEAVATP